MYVCLLVYVHMSLCIDVIMCASLSLSLFFAPFIYICSQTDSSLSLHVYRLSTYIQLCAYVGCVCARLRIYTYQDSNTLQHMSVKSPVAARQPDVALWLDLQPF